MEHYIYYPFRNGSLDPDTKTSQTHYRGRYGEKSLITTSVVWKHDQPCVEGKPALADLDARSPAHVVLIIDCHGNGQAFCRIRDIHNAYEDYLSPGQLAAQLKADRLPLTHQWIKLNVCRADRRADAADSSAVALAKALGGEGYSQVLVGAMQGDLTVHPSHAQNYGCINCGTELPQNHGFRFQEVEGADPVFASDATTYYNVRGEGRSKAALGRGPLPVQLTKHHCPTCGPIAPKRIGKFREAGKLLYSMVEKKEYRVDEIKHALAQRAYPSAPPMAHALGGGPSWHHTGAVQRKNKKCSNPQCNKQFICTTKTTCDLCGKALL